MLINYHFINFVPHHRTAVTVIDVAFRTCISATFWRLKVDTFGRITIVSGTFGGSEIGHVWGILNIMDTFGENRHVWGGRTRLGVLHIYSINSVISDTSFNLFTIRDIHVLKYWYKTRHTASWDLVAIQHQV